MTAPTDPEREALARYLRALARCLASLPADERDDLLRETESHLLDRAESGVPLARACADLGEPADYARRFVEDYRVEVALASGSAWRMLAAASGLLGRGLAAFLGFPLFLVLFIVSIALVAAGLLKPFFPRQVGAWSDGDSFTIGWLGTPGAADVEHLGWWLVPVGLFGGTLLFLATRWLLSTFLRGLRDATGSRGSSAG